VKFWTQPSNVTVLLEFKCKHWFNNWKIKDHDPNFSLFLQLRSALLWDITQRRVVIPHICFGKAHRSHLQMTSWLLKMGPIVYPETSVRNYASTLRNIPQESRSHLHRDGSLKSRIIAFHCCSSHPYACLATQFGIITNRVSCDSRNITFTNWASSLAN
jgi:hypothetical protein